MSDLYQNLLPPTSPTYQTLQKTAQSASIVIISGLPGVGKSLYINQFKRIADGLGKQVTVIQWDMARKAFEIPTIAAQYPMGDGVVHNGLKICAGKWLIDTVQDWLSKRDANKDLLLIEAPLVGHRFIELVKPQHNADLESILASEVCQVLVPIPSKQVRAKIEADRRAQIAEDAQSWTGAKPSVMLMLWKQICGIANELGKAIPMEGQPPYDPEIYEFVFSKILKHRHFIPLHIDEIFDVTISNENELHNLGSLSADEPTALLYCKQTTTEYPNDESLNALVNSWYLT